MSLDEFARKLQLDFDAVDVVNFEKKWTFADIKGLSHRLPVRYAGIVASRLLLEGSAVTPEKGDIHFGLVTMRAKYLRTFLNYPRTIQQTVLSLRLSCREHRRWTVVYLITNHSLWDKLRVRGTFAMWTAHRLGRLSL